MSSTRKRYLIIAEKPSIAKHLRDVYKRMGDVAKFDADIVPANNNVINLNDNMLVHDMGRDRIVALPVLCLKNREVNEDFRVDAEGMWAGCGRRIADLIGKNQYDAIVNACDNDEEGELKFQYVVESMGLEEYETRKLEMYSLTEAEVVEGLMTLN